MNTIQKEEKLIAVYARVSTSAQEVQETIEAQLLEVRKFATQRGYTIIKEYLDEGWSGDVLARPALDELRLDAKKKIWDAVLIYDPDRLGRRYYYQELVIDELKQLGVETLFVTVPPVKDMNDRMMSGMRGLFAEYERAKITERFRIGKLSRVNKGNVLVSEAPYGYTYILNSGKRGGMDYVVGHYEINESEALVVRMIFGWVADEGLTLRAVVKRLQEQKISPRKSKRGVWNTSTLSTLLRNQTYIGIAHWGTSYAVVPKNPLNVQKYKKNKKTSRKMRPTDEWQTVAVPRIIEDALFYKAGKRLKDNFALMGRNKKNDYLLSGMIYCTCGKRRTGEGVLHGKHLYYRCTDRVYSFPLPRTCEEKGVNARIADELIWQRMKELFTSPELMKAQIERWKKTRENNVTNKLVVDVESSKKEISKLKTREERYTNAYSEGVITLEKLKEYLVPIKERIALLENDIAQSLVVQGSQSDTFLVSDAEIESFAKEVVGKIDNLSFEAKRGIMLTSQFQAYSSQKSVQVYGTLNLHQIHVEYFTNHRHRRTSQRRQVDSL